MNTFFMPIEKFQNIKDTWLLHGILELVYEFDFIPIFLYNNYEDFKNK